MTRKVLLVDDDENILSGYQRVLRKTVDLEVALGGEEALRKLDLHGPFAVVVADMRMPGMTGLQLLWEIQEKFPETIRIMLTGNTDQKTAADAVNHGRVFRFLSKPCTPEELGLAIGAGIRQHELIRAERELLDGTLTGAIEVLSELLASVDPASFSLGLTVRRRCGEVARKLGISDPWDIEVAAMLARIGRIALPREVLKANSTGSETQTLLARIPEVGASMIQSIPRMEAVAEIIRYQNKGFDGSGTPEEGHCGADIPMGARILRAVQDFTQLETIRRNRSVALEELKLHGRAYDPLVLDALDACFTGPDGPGLEVRMIPFGELAPGMILAGDLETASGQLVLAQGLRLGHGHLELLRNVRDLLGMSGRVPILESTSQG